VTTIKVRPSISSPFVYAGSVPMFTCTIDLGAVTGGSPVTVTHNLGTFDVAVQIVEKDTAGAGAAAGTVVDATVALTSVNALTVTFTNSAAANLYRVTVFAAGSGAVGQSVNVQTDSYTLVLADAGKLLEMGKATAQNLTVPLNSSVAFPVGVRVDILQTGAGQVTVVATGGVTIDAKTGLKLEAQWAAATLIKRATDTWVLVGALSA
jgi:hypothetical protein